MADYGTGSGGTIRIEDTGSYINITLHAGSSSTFVNGATFSWSDPLGSGSQAFNYPSGAPWLLVKQLGPFGPGQGGTVYFTLNSTGTSGLGGPTSVSFGFSRATAPAAPTMIGIDQLTHQAFRVRFSGNSDGGTPIREWQIGYGLSPTNTQYYVGSGGTTTINTSFAPGSTVYAWARGRNDVGWSGWSARASGVLLPGAKVRVSGVWKDAVPYVKVNGVWVPAIPYVRKAGVWTPTTY